MNAPTLVTETLDRLERELPALPATWVRLNRAVAHAGVAQVNRLSDTVNKSVDNLVTVGRTSSRTIVGQARAAGDQVLKTTLANLRQVSGQVRAQGRRVADVASGEVGNISSEVRRQSADVAEAVENSAESTVKAAERSARSAARSAERQADTLSTKTASTASGRGYESWTKSDLLARAQELDIEGRTTMNKRQLIAALRNA